MRDRFQNFSLALESSNVHDTENIDDYENAKSKLESTVQTIENTVLGVRSRHTALFNILSSQNVSKSTENAARKSLLNRPLEWIEIVDDVNRNSKSKSKSSKQTVIVDDIPPSFNAIPCKPVFFDIACNFIEFPDLDERAGIKKKSLKSASSSTSNEPPSTGIVQNLFGWFSR